MKKKQLLELRNQVKKSQPLPENSNLEKESVYKVVRKRLKKLGKVSFNEEDKIVTLFLNKVMGVSILANVKTKVGYQKWTEDFTERAIDFSNSINENLDDKYIFKILRPESKIIDQDYKSDNDLVLEVIDGKITYDYVNKYIDQESLTEEIDQDTDLKESDVQELAENINIDNDDIEQDVLEKDLK